MSDCERITPVALYKRATVSNSLPSPMKKERQESDFLFFTKSSNSHEKPMSKFPSLPAFDQVKKQCCPFWGPTIFYNFLNLDVLYLFIEVKLWYLQFKIIFYLLMACDFSKFNTLPSVRQARLAILLNFWSF